jgi:hypothetical protein
MKRLTALAAAAALTACGGGGSDETSTTTPAPVALTAEGFWTGTASTGPQVQLVILENGESWGFYTSQGSLIGALYGNTNSSGTSVSGSGLDFYNGTANAGTYSGIFSAKNTLNLSLRSGTSTSTSTFAGKYSAAYDQPALLSNLAGTYAGYALTASGKNIFDIRLTYTGSFCALGNGTVTNGIAYFDTSTKQVAVLALNASKTDGFVYAGVR